MIEMKEQLYNATKDQEYFTVEDFRRLGLHKNIHPNAIGQFFKQLSDRKEIKTCGVTRATHPEANRRWIFKWKWVNE
jgi:hypothetical protein